MFSELNLDRSRRLLQRRYEHHDIPLMYTAAHSIAMKVSKPNVLFSAGFFTV